MELFLKKVENAFGIKSLHLNLENDKKMYQELIYSKNGSFKTSFSNTLYNLSNGTLENVFDRLTTNRVVCDIHDNLYNSQTNNDLYFSLLILLHFRVLALFL